MKYHIDDKSVSLAVVKQRIEGTDLVPSRASLLEGINEKFQLIEQAGIKTLAELRNELKTKKRLEQLSVTSDVDIEYLTLLRREIEGYFPKPSALKDFDWLPAGEISKLEENGLKNISALYETVTREKDREEIINSTKIDVAVLDELIQLADLSRVQWVSPTASRMLLEAGCNSASSLAKTDADELYERLNTVNESGRYFKGKIGLRDVKRLVKAAGYLL
jgi:hypothetical protein